MIHSSGVLILLILSLIESAIMVVAAVRLGCLTYDDFRENRRVDLYFVVGSLASVAVAAFFVELALVVYPHL
jgi:hypothetical protein